MKSVAQRITWSNPYGRDFRDFNVVYRNDPTARVVAATPIDLAALLKVSKPVVRARYEFAETGEPTLAGLVAQFLGRALPASAGTPA